MLVIQAIIFMCIFSTVLCVPPNLILYDQQNQKGNELRLSSSADLQQQNFANKTRSVCVQGLYLFYQKQQFYSNVEYVYSKSKSCTNLNMLSGKVNSVRFAGSSEDTQIPTLTSYYLSPFGYSETKVYTQNAYLYPSMSIIITGSSNWTVYDQASYKGNSICLVSPGAASGTPGLLSQVTFPNNSNFGNVISAKKDCDSQIKSRRVLMTAQSQGVFRSSS